MEKTIEVNGNSFVVKKLKYKQIVELADFEKESEKSQKIIQDSTGMSNDDYNNLEIVEGIELQKVILELNNLSNFQSPLASNQS